MNLNTVIQYLSKEDRKRFLAICIDKVKVTENEIEVGIIANKTLYAADLPTDPARFGGLLGWYTGPRATQTRVGTTYLVVFQRPDLDLISKIHNEYRNPVIYARELHDEMIRDCLSRKQLAERHGVTSDRITQWLCLLKLPAKKQREIEAMGDYWERQVITERRIRGLRIN